MEGRLTGRWGGETDRKVGRLTGRWGGETDREVWRGD